MRKLVLLVPVLLALSLIGCGGGATTTPTASTTPPATTRPATTPPATGTTAIDPAALFAANCAPCHGADRSGSAVIGAPALTPTSLANVTIAAIVQTITNGVPGTAMPVWGTKLSSDQINALANFVKNTPP